LRSLERLIEKSEERNHQRISSLDESLALWKRIGMAATGVLAFFLILAFYISYTWNSTTNAQLAAIRQQLESTQGYSREVRPSAQERLPEPSTLQLEAPATPSTGQGISNLERARQSKTIAIPNSMNSAEIRAAYCSRYPQGKNFATELKALNSGSFDQKGVVKGGQSITLPIECGA
jgi:hypothetical protein